MSEATKPKRNYRTPEQMIADFEAKIEAVKARTAAKEAKHDPTTKALIAAVRGLDKAARVVGERDDADALRAVEAARVPLSDHLLKGGVRVVPRKGRGGGEG